MGCAQTRENIQTEILMLQLKKAAIQIQKKEVLQQIEKLTEQNKILANQNTSQKMKNRFHKKRKSQKIALSQRRTNTNDSTDTVPELPEVYV